MLIGHAGELEKFQWFVRAHLENAGGQLASQGRKTEKACRPQRQEEGTGQVGGVVVQGVVSHRPVGEFLTTAEQVRVGGARDRGADSAVPPRTPTAAPVRRRR